MKPSEFLKNEYDWKGYAHECEGYATRITDKKLSINADFEYPDSDENLFDNDYINTNGECSKEIKRIIEKEVGDKLL